MKTCNTCGETLNLSEFDKRSDTGKYRNSCKQCERKRKNEWKRKDKILNPDKYKKYNEKANIVKKERYKTDSDYRNKVKINSLKNYIHVGKRLEEKTKKFICKSKEIHGDKFTYEKTKYLSGTNKIIITCKKHGDISISRYNHIYHKQGCKQCANENYSYNLIKLYTENEELGNKMGIIYCIKIINEMEVFYKVGVTRLSITERFSSENINYEVVNFLELPNLECAKLEKVLHNKYKHLSYTPSFKFGGWTECFTEEINLSPP